MLGRTHMLGGLVAWEAVAPAAPGPWPVRAVGAAFAVWGSLGPDMDHAKSTLAHSVPAGPWIAKRISKAVGGHRQGTHSLLSIPLAGLAVLGLLALAASLAPFPMINAFVWALAWGVGWTSHLLEDMLTVQGIGLFYPLTKRRVSVGRLRTSKNRRHLNTGERLVSMTLVVTGGLLALSMLGGFIVQTGPDAVDHHGGSAGNAVPRGHVQP
jgi:membrane-bound metal-dependent hydrolase YbcI (DUF457 family)